MLNYKINSLYMDKFQKRRILNTYVSVVISISLVFFLVGFLFLFILNSNKVANNFKEQIALIIFFKDDAKEIEIKQLQKTFLLKKETKNVVFISKEDAAKKLSMEIGEDFMNFLGYNPLHNSINIFFNSSYINSIFLKKIKEDYENKDFIDEILYDAPLIKLLDVNINKISRWIILVSLIFLFIAVLLINNSIRLSIYSKRLVIKTMQLVGATKGFITRPFIKKYILLGIYGSLISIGGLSVLVYYFNKKVPELNLLNNPIEIISIFTLILLLSILITTISSFFATKKFLQLKSEII